MATSDGDTVTVTGAITDATVALTLSVNETINIIWDATIIATDAHAGNMINLYGSYSSSTFTIVGGKTWVKSNGSAIFSDSPIWTIIISGGELIQKGIGTAISSFGNVVVNNGKVMARQGTAIYATDPSATIDILGGFVFAYGTEIKGTEATGGVLRAYSVHNIFVASLNPVVIAWEYKLSPQYAENSSTDIVLTGTSNCNMGKAKRRYRYRL